ncbi:Hypothetical predicted protein [Octopus vulgaris]|uniref:Uncharacterized protein n=1 Tax=Octopus vulgaris TaxID=6645 RepID=A0AA36AGY8_OCTVU|nr:Hypothetical predicted protein [Octopus vulgaris]
MICFQNTVPDVSALLRTSKDAENRKKQVHCLWLSNVNQSYYSNNLSSVTAQISYFGHSTQAPSLMDIVQCLQLVNLMGSVCKSDLDNTLQFVNSGNTFNTSRIARKVTDYSRVEDRKRMLISS